MGVLPPASGQILSGRVPVPEGPPAAAWGADAGAVPVMGDSGGAGPLACLASDAFGAGAEAPPGLAREVVLAGFGSCFADLLVCLAALAAFVADFVCFPFVFGASAANCAEASFVVGVFLLLALSSSARPLPRARASIRMASGRSTPNWTHEDWTLRGSLLGCGVAWFWRFEAGFCWPIADAAASAKLLPFLGMVASTSFLASPKEIPLSALIF